VVPRESPSERARKGHAQRSLANEVRQACRKTRGGEITLQPRDGGIVETRSMDCGTYHGQVSVVVSLIPVAVSASAVVVGLATYVVGLATYRRARPRLAVSVQKEVIIGVGSRTRIFSIVIDNVGHGGITVPDVGLHADRANGQRMSVRDCGRPVSRCKAPISRTESMALRITQRGG
jgi:hypothetical protein